MKSISPQSFKDVIGAEQNNSSVAFINVCTVAEYKEQHIPGVNSLPLDELDKRHRELSDKKTIYVHCRSGNRGARAIEKLTALGITAELVNVDGGLLAWDEAGFSTKSLTDRLPIMRQVLIAAGSLTLTGFIGAHTVHEYFRFIIPVVGAGLLFSGLSGWCGMAYVLGKMPWNK